MKMVAVILGLYGAMVRREERDVIRILENLDTSNPRVRPRNKWDTKFEEFVPVLYKYDIALDFINRFGYVCETYFLNLGEEDAKNIAFQLKICSVWQNTINDEWYIKYPNLLHFFLLKWDLDDAVKAELLNDSTKKEVVRMYNKFAELKG